MNTLTINIGSDFSKTPFGRYESDGPYCGEIFRKKILVPALKEYDHVVVNLDDVQKGYEFSSSFLHESFGGLILEEGMSSDEVLNKLEIVCSYKDIVQEIADYVVAPDQYL